MLMCSIPDAFESRVLWALSCFASFTFPGHVSCMNSEVSVYQVSNGYFEKVFCCWRTCVGAGVGSWGYGRRWAPGVGTGGGALQEPITGPWVEKGQQESICGRWWLEARQVIRPHCHREQCATLWLTGELVAFILCHLLATVTWKLLL